MGQVHDFTNVDVLERYGRELTNDPNISAAKIYGRGVEVEALIRALGARRSAVLLGPPGVGKTAIIWRFLHLIKEKLPQISKVFEISTVGLCADTSYTGELEGKIRALLEKATQDRLVYVPDLWNLPTAGSYDTNPRGCYDLLRPGVESGQLILFGETTSGRWEKLCRQFPSLTRDFVTISVKEMEEPETRDLLKRAAADLGAKVSFDKSSVDKTFSLAKKFLPTQSFPGKGIDLLRKMAEAAPQENMKAIDADYVEAFFSKQTGLPLHMISPKIKVTFEEMRAFLSERVLGQEEAVDAVADMLALYKTGLKNPDKPAGVLLFVGPTGVGKTELAKATAEFLFGSSQKLYRVDLSEYKDYHSFEKLIGDPQRNKTGLLTDHVRQNPFSAVLLDEFEKGHPNIADLFLQVFDDGRLTDAAGETIDFRHTLLILTSNVGTEAKSSPGGIGFGGAEEAPEVMTTRVKRALEASYRPEFLNRLDRVLVFKSLGREDMRRIAHREIGKLYQREGLLDRDLLLEIDEGVIDLLLEKGFDPKYGARPLKRAIEVLLVMPLARALLAIESRRFQLLRIARRGEKIALSFEDTDSSRKLIALERRTKISDGEGNTIHLSVAEVGKELKEIKERLLHIESIGKIAAARKELTELAAKESRPGYWEEAFGKDGELWRRHRLAVEVKRYDDIQERTELLREMVEASFQEAEDSVAKELLEEFVLLKRQIKRAERELLHFTGGDQGDALISLRPTGGKEGTEQWVKELSMMYAAWSNEHEYQITTIDAGDGVELRIEGPYAYGYLKAEHGGHRVITPPKDKERKDKEEEKRGEAFLVRVDVRPLAPNSITPPKNKDDDPPIRTYDMWRARGARDRRTGHTESDIKKVFSGKIDSFIEAFLDASNKES
jgi:ATP-dependent Clp protease ATP-binding subunit ClpC